MRRRTFLAASAGFALAPVSARAGEASRVKLPGSLEQGSLVIGRTEPGARIALDGANVSLTPQGAFAFGFAFDRTNPATLVLDYAGGKSETREIVPVIRQYDIQRINGLPEKYVSPPPEILERIKRENEMAAAARTVDSAFDAFAEPFDWPVAGIVSGTFGNRRILNGEPRAPHFGVDIAAPEGTPIAAPADGIVVLAAPDFYLTGGTGILDHGHGVFTAYLHQSKLEVAVGDKIKRGQIIGLVGRTGRATGPHLHWGMNWFQVRLDPSRSARTLTPPKAA